MSQETMLISGLFWYPGGLYWSQDDACIIGETILNHIQKGSNKIFTLWAPSGTHATTWCTLTDFHKTCMMM